MSISVRTMRQRTQSGLTLVELLISVALGLVLITAVTSVYVFSSSTARSGSAQARLQENSRILFDILATEIRQSSYFGCGGQDAGSLVQTTLNSPATFMWDFSKPIYGYEATGSVWNETVDSRVTSPVAGSDILVVRSVDEGGGPVIGHASATAPIVIPAKSQVSTGDIVMASDCVSAIVFQVTSVTSTVTSPYTDSLAHAVIAATATSPGNSTDNLSKTYKAGEARRVSTKAYFVRNNPDGIASLYVVRNGDAAPIELVTGVENLQFEYGVDDNADFAADRYINASAVTTANVWANVVSVRVSAVVMTEDVAAATSAQSNALGTGTDRRLRQRFTSTITIRNRAG